MLKRSFCSLISCIFAKSSSADFKKSSDVIGSGFLFAQETIIPRAKTNNIFNKFPDIGLELKNELKKWLILSNAIIPEKDPLHNYEKEKKWLIENKQKIK